MNRAFISITLAILSALALQSCSSSGKVASSKKNAVVDVNTAFEKVYNATQAALKRSNNTLSLESIDLAFATTVSSEFGGGAKLWVVTPMYSRGKSKAKTTTFTFGRGEAKSGFVEDEEKEFIEYLVSVINATNIINPIDNFGLKEVEVEMEFTTSNTGSVEVEVELVPITPKASYKRGKESVHTITLKFKKPEPAKPDSSKLKATDQ
ncbi:hypothetical protein EFA69_12785 [Rufibacter immobilis]|uniref:Trypsin-co-occurring domain-containing protein n=1 Tax=Rufibacter immobilis TaxID=1348778 RepID=A0A3M9MTS0_9BACT|nr:trypco2 family protein [Rufibacter immobilis]RNI28916.1 hypothetical protein EFA69_12785 [Rufibacter immobilis]